MIRLWLLVWYFTRLDRPRAGDVPSWTDEISRFDFWAHLAHQKHFCEDWRSTIRRLHYFLGDKRPSQTTERGMRWAKKQIQDINDLIDKAIKYEYLVIARISAHHPTSSEIYLTIDWKGRNFLKPIPFINACLKEHGYLVAFISGAGGATLLLFFDRIVSLISAKLQ